jgi:hypothetical protein
VFGLEFGKRDLRWDSGAFLYSRLGATRSHPQNNSLLTWWEVPRAIDWQDEERNSRLLSRHRTREPQSATETQGIAMRLHLSASPYEREYNWSCATTILGSNIKAAVAKQLQATSFGPCLRELGLRGSELMTRIYKDRVNCTLNSA